MKIKLPQQVAYIIGKLEEHGYEAYAVGGCVRDSILGRIPDDWDITTSAKPKQVKAVFGRTIDTGIQHGTVTVMLEKCGYEVTTYRIDGEYEDSRHPKEVIFTNNLVEDLKRRDFTINAMAYSPKAGLIDVFDGMGDIKRKIIRCVGTATERFGEDALRILRAVRFGAQLGFQIEEETREAIKKCAKSLANISAERIQTELLKLLVSSQPERLKEAYELGITEVILPELDACFSCEQENIHHCYNVGDHIMKALTYIPNGKVERLAILFHDIGKPEKKTMDEQGQAHFYNHAARSKDMTDTIMRRLKFDNDTRVKVMKLVELHDARPALKRKSVKKLIVKAGPELFLPLMEVKRADTYAQSEYERQEKLSYIHCLETLYHEILEKEECISIKALALDGNDLLELGVPKGKQIGEILKELFEFVLEDPDRNTREYLTEEVRKRIHI